MNRPVLRDSSALAAGLLFGAGLLVSGMTNPRKVLGFLDVFGAWDASLMFVMLGAIGVHLFAYRMIRGRSAPLFAPKFVIPSRRDVDAKLLIGAALFGAGWGLGGYCPGPGIVSLPGGSGAAVFVLAMLTGMFATGKLEARLARDDARKRRVEAPSPQPERAATS
ncbi:MAG TPA: YeeE/YedE family protein [Polyangiales bacterium]|nr:YeeE/YedE family protein [Polyangiales bacterium]